jgi:hypothetical protein
MRGYTRRLEEAGRYTEEVAQGILAQCNLAIQPTDWPDEVMIPVVNGYLHEVGRKVIEEFDQ